jgi:uncharacterized protein (DUF1330 family)
MSAYIVSEVKVRDRTALEEYRSRAADSIAQYGGRYLVRGGSVEPLEGRWFPELFIIVEFPDAERARAWYRSAEYAAALKIRDTALVRNLILAEGVVPP